MRINDFFAMKNKNKKSKILIGDTIMLRYTIYIIVLLTLTNTTSYSQLQYNDEVYLKDGSFVRGLIIEQKPNQFIKIMTFDKNIQVYSVLEIQSISKSVNDNYKYQKESVNRPEELSQNSKIAEDPNTKDINIENVKSDKIYSSYGKVKSEPSEYPSNNDSDFQSYKTTGHMKNIKFGILSLPDETIFSLYYESSIQSGENFAWGAGVGYENYPNGTMIPIYFNFKANTSTAPLIPYTYADFGYSFGSIDGVDGFDAGGLMYGGGVGLKIHVGYSSAILLDIGYRIQHAKALYTEHVWNAYYSSSWSTTIDQEYGMLKFNVGFCF